jgi:hypothetical protein
MNSNIKNLLATSLLLLLPLATGCGKAGNPMAPKVEPAAAESLDVKVTLVRIEALLDGDGIEGPGDFDFAASVYDGAPPTLEVSGFEHIDAGSHYTIERSRTIRCPKDDSYRIIVKFEATEWDGDIFGGSWPDTRMDHLKDQHIIVNGSSSNDFNLAGERYITLGGDELRIRLVYRMTSTPTVH